MAPDAVITERVYTSVKEQILSGHIASGDRLEVKAIAYDERTSITPVRDAIHRLVGERLLELQAHGGFQVPILSEAGLRDLYAWHFQLVLLAVGERPLRNTVQPSSLEMLGDGAGDMPIVDLTETIFVGIFNRSGNRELRAAAAAATERLRPVRHAEARIISDDNDIFELREIVAQGDAEAISEAVGVYHKRRVARVAEFVETLRRS